MPEIEILAAWAAPEIVVDILLLIGITIGLYRNSRAAAVVAILYLVMSTFFVYMEMGQISGVGMKLIFLYYFVKAAQGAWAFHRIEARENPDYRSAPGWMYWIGIPVGVLFFGLFGLGLMTMTPLMPSTEVVSGQEVSDSELAALRENDLLYEGETVEYFYSYGFTSVLEGGTILSNRAVISYWQNDSGALEAYEFEFQDIQKVEEESPGSYFEDAVYIIYGPGDENWFSILLSIENNGHKKFMQKLNEKIGK